MMEVADSRQPPGRARRPLSRCGLSDGLIMNFGDPGKALENRKQNKLMLPGSQFPLLENEQGSQECLLT